MVSLSDLSFAIYDISTGQVHSVDPSRDEKISQGTIERGFSEKATELLYGHHFRWHIEQINQRRKRNRLKYALERDNPTRDHVSDLPAELKQVLTRQLIEHTEVQSDHEALQAASIDGIPDFLACSPGDTTDFHFIEAKRGGESLQRTQVEWFQEFDFFPTRIVYVFDEAVDRDQFVASNSLERLLEGAEKKSSVDSMSERQELPTEEIARRIATLEVGDKVVFNNRKKPVEVVDIDIPREVRGREEKGVEIATPSGNRYLLSETGEFFVEKDNRRKLKWLRRVTE